MTAQPKRKLTPEEYLAIEEKAEFKSEYFNGEMFAMAGVSIPHNDVSGNMFAELHGRLKGTPCRIASSDQRVLVNPSGLYTYPDIVITCGQRETDPKNRDTITNPTAIIEVLSPSTEGYDRGKKFERYREVATLREYVLVAQDAPRINRFVRQPDDTWTLTFIAGMDAVLTFESVPAAVPLAEIYRGVTFTEATEEGGK